MLANKLKQFRPESRLTLWRVPPTTEALGTSDLLGEYGFKEHSMQHGFFTRPPPSNSENVVFALCTGDVPATLDSASVVARMFGRTRGPELEIWYVGVRPHALNNSDRGMRWGVYGIVLDKSRPKARWYGEDGHAVTRRNCEAKVRGSPNPYATRCIYEACKRLGCTVVRQHESMPCAQLFDAQYDHTSHPATMLIYRTLGFERPPGLDFYYWNESDGMVDMKLAYKTFLYRMRVGIPAIYDASSLRRAEGVRPALRIGPTVWLPATAP